MAQFVERDNLWVFVLPCEEGALAVSMVAEKGCQELESVGQDSISYGLFT